MAASYFDHFHRLDKLDSVVIMLLHPRRYRQYVWIEYDVVLIEADFLDEQLVRSRAYFKLPLRVRSLDVGTKD